VPAVDGYAASAARTTLTLTGCRNAPVVDERQDRQCVFTRGGWDLLAQCFAQEGTARGAVRQKLGQKRWEIGIHERILP
jgi:hypothetical protein